jgi:tetratricopeptide (TPR) repeat protein
MPMGGMAPANPQQMHEPPLALTAGMQPAQKALTLGNWYYDHEQWPRAISQYQTAISGGIDNANVRTDLGNAFRLDGQPQKALEQYRLAQKQDPKHEQSFFNQGGLYRFSFKQPQKAIAIWREYLKRFPEGQSVGDARRLIRETQAKRTGQ